MRRPHLSRGFASGAVLSRIVLSAVASLGAILPCVVVAAEEREEAGPPPSEGRMDDLRARAASLRIFDEQEGGGGPISLIDAPLLRYNDPARATSDGALWAWGTQGRPVALCCLFVEPKEEGDRWNYELLSLHDGPLFVDGRRDWTWRPREGELSMQRLPDAPEPAAGKPARLTQMKRIARRFAARERWFGEEFQLRLLPQPIHRYADPDSGIEDGAMFAFAYGTNPEVVLFLECRSEDGDEARRWQYGAARLSAADLWLRLDDEVVWQVEQVKEWTPEGSYFSAFGPDDAADEEGASDNSRANRD